MGRALRHYRPGIYHLAAHGSDRRHLYLSDHDRTDFLDRLSNTLWQRDIDLLASASLADDPLDWPWASTRAHAGIEPVGYVNPSGARGGASDGAVRP